ncbi:retrovirus-related pol polyprotein from transposon TNT 1-94 [Tanacetum coccineum]
MSSSSSNTQNMAFMSSANNNTSSFNQAVNTAHEVSAASTQANIANSTNINSLSDDVICAFLASQPSSPQLVNEDLEQIYPDDLEEMNLKWQMAMLTMRARRFLKKTKRKMNVNGTKTIGFDKSKVECYNCHKKRHFARECRAPRKQDNRNKESTRRNVPVETSNTTTLVSYDGLGYDWSDQAEEGPNYALMAYSSSSSDTEIVDNCKKGLGYGSYSDVPPLYTGNFMPLKLDLSFVELDESVTEPTVENTKATKDETSGILKNFITRIENLLDHRVKLIRCDNGTELNNSVMNQFYEMKGIKREFSVARTPQLNRVAERKNRTLIEAARTMLVDSKLPTTFWPEAVNTACYVQNRSQASKETKPGRKYILLPLWTPDPPFFEDSKDQEEEENVNSTYTIYTVNAADTNEASPFDVQDDPNMPELEEISRFSDAEDDNLGADMNNLDTYFPVNPITTIRIHKPHPLNQIIRDLQSATQTRHMKKNLKNQKGLPNRKRAIVTKWVFRNKMDERGIMIRNKARLVAQGYIQEQGINYDEVFALVVRIEAIRLFLAYASFKDFMVYQIDVKSAFLYGKIEEEVYLCQPPGFEDPDFPDKVYKVEKALYGLHQAPRAWYETLSTYLLNNRSHRGKIDKPLFNKRYTEAKIASTPMENHKPLLKDEDNEEVDVHMYRSMIGSLMYLTSSRPDIMFAVCACARYQVNPKISHLYAVKRIFRYLKGQPKLGLWYLKDSTFDLVAYTDSDYAGASLDKKSTTRGCQFLGCRLISW